MSDAIEGEAGAYVPCLELPSPFPADPDGAITGSSVGFVSKDMLASPMPADPVGAIVGSGVGFVAKECEEEEECVDGRLIKIVDTFNRLNLSVWDTAIGDYDIDNPAGTWVADRLYPSTTEAVDGDYGVVNNSGYDVAQALTDMFLGIPTAWFVDKAWVECRWQVKANDTNKRWYLYNASYTEAIFFEISDAGISPSVIFGRYQSGGNFFTFVASSVNIEDPFWVALRLEGGVLQCKQWTDGDAEPASWSPFTVSGVALDVADIANCVHRSLATGPTDGPFGNGSGSSWTGYIEITVPC